MRGCDLTTGSMAIDGPVASGKTAVGRLLADRLGFGFLDTGLMYRAVTLAALCRRISPDDDGALSALAADMTIEVVSEGGAQRLLVDGEDVTGQLRDPAVERVVSRVSEVSGVRAALVRRQREMSESAPVVMVGRDIGTVVLPDAGLKVYLEASVEVRARRRHRELEARGDPPPLEQVVDDLTRRDKMDSQRADSPLRAACDAVRIFTDDLDVEGVVERVMGMIDHPHPGPLPSRERG